MKNKARLLILSISLTMSSMAMTDDLEDTDDTSEPAHYNARWKELEEMPGFPKEPNSPNSQKTNGQKSLISQYDETLRGVMNKLPNSSLKNGLKKYLEIINAKSYATDSDVGGSNAGIAAYATNMVKDNPCFAKLAEALYTDIYEHDKEYIKKHEESYRKSQLMGRPSLAESSGEGAHKELKPGWLFEKALKYSKGDPNLAMNLLAICGHDDVSQGDFYYSVSSRNADTKTVQNEYLRVLDAKISFSKQVLEYTDPVDAKERTQYIKELEAFRSKFSQNKVKFNPKLSREVQCPENFSSFYLAKALGESADLTPNDKKRISSIQAPTKGAAALPGKNYHLIGAAFMACNLISEGISPRIAESIQTLAGWAYRTVRISTIINEDLEELETVEEAYEKDMRERRKENRRAKLPTFETWLLANSQVDYDADNENTNIAPQKVNLPPFVSMEDVQNWLVKLDAARVLDDMTVGGGKIFGKSLPHSNITLSFLDNPIQQYINENFSGNKFNPRLRMSPERYKKASDKAKTYLMDWEWTTKQHQAGAHFSAQTCKRKPENFKIEDTACEAFDGQPGITCRINYQVKAEERESLYLPSELDGHPMENHIGFFSDFQKINDALVEDTLDPNVSISEDKNGIKINGLW